MTELKLYMKNQPQVILFKHTRPIIDNILGLIHDFMQKRIVWIIGIIFIILVAISRLYLRVHWLSDIIGAVLFSVIIVYLYTKVTMELSDRKFILLQRIILAVSLIMYVMTSQVDNFKLLGVLTGSTIGIMLENHFINMNESDDFKMQVVKQYWA